MTLATRQDAALTSARAQMLRRAAERSEQTVAQASRASEALVARARRDAEAAVARARADGAAQAGPLATAERHRSREEIRSRELAAERAVHDELAGQIRSAVCGLRAEPGYPELRDRLTELALRAAGPDAVVTEHADGGVTARAAGRLVDCSLPRLADRVIELLGPSISRLCS